jgi:hypothetical protein
MLIKYYSNENLITMKTKKQQVVPLTSHEMNDIKETNAPIENNVGDEIIKYTDNEEDKEVLKWVKTGWAGKEKE